MITAAAQRYQEYRAKETGNSMKILIDTGALLRSMHYQADSTSVAIGTNKNYAAEQQEGIGRQRAAAVSLFLIPFTNFPPATR